MSTPRYPANLPGVSSLSLTPTSQVVAPEEGPGALNYRRLTRVPHARASVVARYLDGDFEVFEDFYITTLKRGHKWFMLPLPSAAGIMPHVVRLIRHRAAPSNGFNYREITMEIEIRGRRMYPDDLEGAGGDVDLPGASGWDVANAFVQFGEQQWLFSNGNRTGAVN